jgi:glycosyltransferase family protein
MRSTVRYLTAFPIYAARAPLYRLPRILDTPETMEYLRLRPTMSLSRFGDGEMTIINGGSIGFQAYDPLLAQRLCEVLQTHCDKHLCGIPNALVSRRGMTNAARHFWFDYRARHGHDWAHWCTQERYVNSLITRPYLDYRPHHQPTDTFRTFANLWAGRDVILVEGEHSHVGAGNDLMDQAGSLTTVLAPSTNAWSDYPALYQSALTQAEHSRDPIVLLALGPTAAVMAFDLARAGIQVLDIGHLDIEYEWKRRGATTKTKIPGKWVNEFGGM